MLHLICCRSAGVGVFTAFFINIVVAVVFFLGTNTAIICRTTPNYELLRNVSLCAHMQYSSIHPFIHSCINSFIHSCMHSFIYPFIHAFIYLFIHILIFPHFIWYLAIFFNLFFVCTIFFIVLLNVFFRL